MATTSEYCITALIILLISKANPMGIESHYAGTTSPRTYCTGKPMTVKCRKNEVVVMINATYGRMKINECVTKDMGFLGCSTNVLKVADKYCSGKESCEMMVPNNDLDNAQSDGCYSELRTYLEASHTCVRVLQPSTKHCRSSVTVSVSSRGGVLSSHITDSTSCGNSLSPYVLKAQKGQILSISIIDFGWSDRNFKELSVSNCNGKYDYGYIKDLSKQDESERIKICGGMSRTRHLITTDGPHAQIVLNEAQLENREEGFLISYETIGCADLIPPKHAWMKREGEKIVIGCNHQMARQTWHLKCDGHNWIGVIGNCTQQMEAAKQAALKSNYGSHIPHGVAIFIIIGIAVLISLAIITVGLYFLNKYKRRGPLPPGNMYQADRQIYEEPKYKTREPAYNGSPDAKAQGNKRNEYTHIWEYPLPEPCSQHGVPPSQISYELSREQGGQVGNNNNTGVPEQYGGSMDSKTTTDSLSRYYALDQTPQDGNAVFHTSTFT